VPQADSLAYIGSFDYSEVLCNAAGVSGATSAGAWLCSVTSLICSTANTNTKRMGRLGLSDAEEDALVSFMQTLTDGFMHLDQR
jgi:hypothetical protein